METYCSDFHCTQVLKKETCLSYSTVYSMLAWKSMISSKKSRSMLDNISQQIIHGMISIRHSYLSQYSVSASIALYYNLSAIWGWIMGGNIALAIPFHTPKVTNRWTMVWAWSRTLSNPILDQYITENNLSFRECSCLHQRGSPSLYCTTLFNRARKLPFTYMPGFWFASPVRCTNLNWFHFVPTYWTSIFWPVSRSPRGSRLAQLPLYFTEVHMRRLSSVTSWCS